MTVWKAQWKVKEEKVKQKKRWEDNIKEWIGMDFAKNWGSYKQEKVGGDCWKIIWCPAAAALEGYGKTRLDWTSKTGIITFRQNFRNRWFNHLYK